MDGQTISVGFWVVVNVVEVVVLDVVTGVVVLDVVVLTVVVGGGAWGQFTFCGKSQSWFSGLNQKDPGQFWRMKIPSEHVKYEEL